MSSIRGGSACIAAHLGSASILIFLRFLMSPLILTRPEIDAPLTGTNASTFGATGASTLAAGASTFAGVSETFTLPAGADGFSSPQAMMSEPPARQSAAADIVTQDTLDFSMGSPPKLFVRRTLRAEFSEIQQIFHRSINAVLLISAEQRLEIVLGHRRPGIDRGRIGLPLVHPARPQPVLDVDEVRRVLEHRARGRRARDVMAARAAGRLVLDDRADLVVRRLPRLQELLRPLRELRRGERIGPLLLVAQREPADHRVRLLVVEAEGRHPEVGVRQRLRAGIDRLQ